MISLAEAAKRLGVSVQRVQQMVAERKLPVETFGNQLVLDSHLFARLSRRPTGRPVSARNAWALLAIISGDRPTFVDRSKLSRLRRLARDRQQVLDALRYSQPRSRVLRYDFFPAQLSQLSELLPLRTGLAAELRELHLEEGGNLLDAYVSEGTLSDIDRRFHPALNVARPNVQLRVPSEPWVLEHGVSPPVVAADLLDDPDPRVVRAAEAVF